MNKQEAEKLIADILARDDKATALNEAKASRARIVASNNPRAQFLAWLQSGRKTSPTYRADKVRLVGDLIHSNKWFDSFTKTFIPAPVISWFYHQHEVLKIPVGNKVAMRKQVNWQNKTLTKITSRLEVLKASDNAPYLAYEIKVLEYAKITHEELKHKLIHKIITTRTTKQELCSFASGKAWAILIEGLQSKSGQGHTRKMEKAMPKGYDRILLKQNSYGGISFARRDKFKDDREKPDTQESLKALHKKQQNKIIQLRKK